MIISLVENSPAFFKVGSAIGFEISGGTRGSDNGHMINLLDDAPKRAESATPPQPTVEVPLALAYKQLENITN